MSKIIKVTGTAETKANAGHLDTGCAFNPADNICESPILSIKVEALALSCKNSDQPYSISTPEIPARSKAIVIVDSFRAPIIVGDCASRIISFDTVRQWRISITNEQTAPVSMMILTIAGTQSL